MNEKFFQLPKEKQLRILNAGFRVFSENSYKKSPMSEIAAEADISKSLLFFYFKNKKELYIFLMKTAEALTKKHLMESGCYQETDIFEMMYKGLISKVALMKKYPYMSKFALKAYYEDDEEVKGELEKIIKPYTRLNTNKMIPNLDPKDYKDGLNLRLMYNDMYLASEGYVYRMQQEGEIDIDKMAVEFREMIDFWKSIYLK